MTQLDDIRQKIVPVLQKYQVIRAGVFGSLAKGDFHSDSDVDILVDWGQQGGLLEFVALKLELEDLLHRPVDLVEYRALKPRLKDSALAEEIRFYG